MEVTVKITDSLHVQNNVRGGARAQIEWNTKILPCNLIYWWWHSLISLSLKCSSPWSHKVENNTCMCCLRCQTVEKTLQKIGGVKCASHKVEIQFLHKSTNFSDSFSALNIKAKSSFHPTQIITFLVFMCRYILARAFCKVCGTICINGVKTCALLFMTFKVPFNKHYCYKTKCSSIIKLK